MSFDEGMQAFKAGDYTRAAEHFVAVTEKDENNHKAWNALGICLSKTGEFEQAGICFENAVTLDPGNDTYRRNKEKNDKKRQVIPEPSLELDDEPVVRAQPSKKIASGYQRNYWQIPLYFIPIILCLASPIVGFLSIILGAWYIKQDADSLNAGSNPNGSAWGKLKGWEWMLLLIFFWILMPVYSWKREQVYNENIGYGSYNGVSAGSAMSLLKIAGGIFAFLIFCMVVAAFVFGMSGSGSVGSPSIQKDDSSLPVKPLSTQSGPNYNGFEVSNTDFQQEQYATYITGTVKNTKNRTYKYVQVEINLYDGSGAQVGSTMANTNNLEPGGVWKFKAIALQDEATNFKIKEITAF